jgi:pyruvate formate lyase activating enzyme
MKKFMNTKPLTCRIYDIKTYAIHDGPGIRTTVFFKGCPLSCLWCHNPEGIDISPRLVWNPRACIGCRTCCDNCLEGALSQDPSSIVIDQDVCTRCGVCAAACPASALELQGRVYTVPELAAVLEKDLIFYDTSGGGVSFSGGEPLAQWQALCALLDECRRLEIHTAVDTSGYAQWKVLEAVALKTDLFLYDLKLMDDASHKAVTGVSNRIILSNLERLSHTGVPVIIRFPMIPDINDRDEDIRQIGLFVSKLPGIRQIDLLPYHGYHISKYKKLGMPYKLKETREPSKERLDRARHLLSGFGLTLGPQPIQRSEQAWIKE